MPAPSSHGRKLAAIMFADIVGYTAMMQADEAGARGTCVRFRSLLQDLVPGHSGEVVQFYGDGALVVQSDGQDVARFVRRHEGDELADGEQLLRYRVRGGELRLGAEDFFFQEGTADLYSDARYGELKVTDGGEALLVGLRGEDFAALGPREANPLQHNR